MEEKLKPSNTFPHWKTQPEEGWKVNVTDSSPARSQPRGLLCPDVIPPLKECAATINIRINAPFIYFSTWLLHAHLQDFLHVESFGYLNLLVFSSNVLGKNLSVFQNGHQSEIRLHVGASLTSPSVPEFLLWMGSFLYWNRSYPQTSLAVTDLCASPQM